MSTAASRIGPTGARLAGAIGLLAVLALALQGIASFGAGAQPPLVPIARFFAQFALLADVLVAACALAATLRPEGGGVLSQPALRGAAACYTAATMVAYGMVLQLPWIASGAQVWADLGLTLIVPILYLSWWVWFAPHGGLRLVHGLAWMLIPIAMLLVLESGALRGGAIPPHVWRVPLLLLGIGMLVILVDRVLAAMPER